MRGQLEVEQEAMERLGEIPRIGWERDHLEVGRKAMERLSERPCKGWETSNG